MKKFSFNPDVCNYWPLYQSIIKYYPIAILKSEHSIYFEYEGIKQLEKIVVDNIHNRENYQNRWVDFCDRISNDLDVKVMGRTGGQAPSFSASINIGENRSDTFVHSKDLYFSVSLVGHFFQIYGLDKTIVKDVDSRGYPSNNVITASPYREYESLFKGVEKIIRQEFVDYKFVPYSIGQTQIDGLCVRYTDDMNCTINMGLFNDFLSGKSHPNGVKGKEGYGVQDWRVQRS